MPTRGKLYWEDKTTTNINVRKTKLMVVDDENANVSTCIYVGGETIDIVEEEEEEDSLFLTPNVEFNIYQIQN